MGSHTIKSWSSTQSAPALSSCEAEYYALVDSATRVLGLQAAAKELRVAVEDVVVGTLGRWDKPKLGECSTML